MQSMVDYLKNEWQKPSRESTIEAMRVLGQEKYIHCDKYGNPLPKDTAQ